MISGRICCKHLIHSEEILLRLLSRRSRQRERLNAFMLSICLLICMSVCLQNAKNASFSKTTELKCIWDDTKAAARQSPNCIKKIINNKTWRKTIFIMADGNLTPCKVARLTLISPGDCTLQCGMWLWNHDSQFTKWQHPAMWYVALGWHTVEFARLQDPARWYVALRSWHSFARCKHHDNNHNNNNLENVYGAVIMAEPFRESPSSFDECWMSPSGRRPKTKPDDLGCESACTGYQKLHPPSPFIIITQPVSWYSFYRPTEGRSSAVTICKILFPIDKRYDKSKLSR